jgi:acetylornithine deacetylase/succinyl-diaminopimelate desuccinylase-like protein
MGAIELETMLLLKRAGVPLKRSVILLAVAAEESDSSGVLLLAQKHWKEIGCSHVVNEGGLGVKDALFPGQTVYAISSAEKGVLWVRMTAHGEAAHGSTPRPNQAPEHLLAALNKLAARKPTTFVDPSLYQLLAQIGHDHGGLKGYLLARPTLVDWFVKGTLMGVPSTRAAITNTINVTGFGGMKEPNVVPAEVWAILDCRVLPGVRPREVLAEIESIVEDKAVTYDVMYEHAANASPWEDPFFDALARHSVDGRPHVVAGPVLSVGYTDSLELRPYGVHAYGLVPFEVTQEEAATMHGRDERVSVENLTRGVRTMFRAVLDVAAAPGPAKRE